MSTTPVSLLLLRPTSRAGYVRSRYRANPRLFVKETWATIMLFTAIQVIVSICVAYANNSYRFGHKSAVFAAIWSMLLVLGFTVVGSTVVFGSQKLTELQLGFFIGTSAMLMELFFVLAVNFYIIGINASANNQKAGPADKAFATFCLLNTFNFIGWTMVLSTNRPVLLEKSSPETATATAVPVYNPVVVPSAPMAEKDDHVQL